MANHQRGNNRCGSGLNRIILIGEVDIFISSKLARDEGIGGFPFFKRGRDWGAIIAFAPRVQLNFEAAGGDLHCLIDAKKSEIIVWGGIVSVSIKDAQRKIRVIEGADVRETRVIFFHQFIAFGQAAACDGVSILVGEAIINIFGGGQSDFQIAFRDGNLPLDEIGFIAIQEAGAALAIADVKAQFIRIFARIDFCGAVRDLDFVFGSQRTTRNGVIQILGQLAIVGFHDRSAADFEGTCRDLSITKSIVNREIWGDINAIFQDGDGEGIGVTSDPNVTALIREGVMNFSAGQLGAIPLKMKARQGGKMARPVVDISEVFPGKS
ncbi:MAG: hypothetical protein BWY98_01225 [Tenericutes bacterium ADurb.BinA155]|nr:MAG: hypothetical protein BWY98_01225 [Tenericutes bacterium ADurb.BinA155]